jgi:alkylation response protein AidB-like acyl-CoA dehydrogenase
MFELGDEMELLVETARSFASDSLAPAMRESEEARQVADAVRGAYSQIGLARLELPEAEGGAGLGPVARALVNEELAAADAGAALALDPLGPALYPLLDIGGAEAVQQFALPLVEAFEDGSPTRALLVVAEEGTLPARASQGDRVSGIVPWVPSDRADLLIVLGPDGAYAVRQGIDVEPLPGSGLRAAGAAELRLTDAPVEASWSDPLAASRSLARARVYVASLLIGVLRQACEFSRAYALERQAFGRPIAHHQALAFLITDMHMAVEGARFLLHEAAWRLDTGGVGAMESAQAFAEIVEASRFVGPNGVQILGGHGFMRDYPVEKYMRESRALGLLLGGVDAAREEAGQALIQTGAPVIFSRGEVA